MEREIMEKLREKAIFVVSETIEDMAFSEVKTPDSTENYEEFVDWINLNWLYSEILFHEPFIGEFRLIMPQGVVTIIAEDLFLIEENNITPNILKDIMGEILNVIAGRLLSAIVPDDKTFELGLPATGKESFLDFQTFSIAIDFLLKGLPFWVVLVGNSLLNETKLIN